jgi:hypothetical protein
VQARWAGRMKNRMRRAKVIALGALVAGTWWTASFAFAQTPSQPAEERDQPRPSGQATVTQAPSAKQLSQDSSPPGPTTKEKENVHHEKETGTSTDRILWTMPNFLTLENADKVPPLTSRQKFKVVGRSLIDPFEFVLIGFVAGLGQASNTNPTYGQGASGYGKRYATSYADNAVENFMASAVLPSLLHQDPRYYQLGHGGFMRRTEHAVSRVLITRSDSGKTQFNYSEIFGAGIAAGISTYTYHSKSEQNFGNVVSVWGTQMGWDIVTYMIKEFWPDLRRKRHKTPQNIASRTQG